MFYGVGFVVIDVSGDAHPFFPGSSGRRAAFPFEVGSEKGKVHRRTGHEGPEGE